MSKPKSNTEITVTANKKSLKGITGMDNDLGLKTTDDKKHLKQSKLKLLRRISLKMKQVIIYC